MGSSAAIELEQIAAKHAEEAIHLDSHGSRAMAIQMYQRAIAVLIKLAHLYPDYHLNRLYIERAKAYQARIGVLQTSRDSLSEEIEEQSPALPPEKRVGGGAPPSKGAQAPKTSFDDLVMQEKPNVMWDEVVGIEDAKQGLRESIIFPYQRPDLFPLGWPRGILLYGPPGCGKTMIAAATAAEVEGTFVSIDAASIMSKWLGEGERNVARLFASARKLLGNGSPAVIIFIDELDSLLGTRSQEVGGEVRVRNQFLAEMDGIADKGRDLHLYIVGATNKPWSLDWPFLRRFQKRIHVPLPSKDARVEMLRLYTRPLIMDENISIEELADHMEGHTGSDIRDACQAVQIRVVSELFASGNALDRSTKPRKINFDDFKEVLRMRRPSVSPEMLRAYTAWSERFMAL